MGGAQGIVERQRLGERDRVGAAAREEDRRRQPACVCVRDPEAAGRETRQRREVNARERRRDRDAAAERPPDDLDSPPRAARKRTQVRSGVGNGLHPELEPVCDAAVATAEAEPTRRRRPCEVVDIERGDTEPWKLRRDTVVEAREPSAAVEDDGDRIRRADAAAQLGGYGRTAASEVRTRATGRKRREGHPRSRDTGAQNSRR